MSSPRKLSPCYSGNDGSVNSDGVSFKQSMSPPAGKTVAPLPEEAPDGTSGGLESREFVAATPHSSKATGIRSEMSTQKSVASSRRAPPQDAPVSTRSQEKRRSAHTPTEPFSGERVWRTPFADSIHDPIQSPPFALFSASKTPAKHDRGADATRNPAGSTLETGPSSTTMPAVSTDDRKDIAMHERVRLQEAQIKSLEAENHALRTQVKRLLAVIEDSGKNETEQSAHDCERVTPEGQSYFYDAPYWDSGRRRSYRDSRVAFDYTPKPNSPGKKFVAEFSELLELDRGHHSLLSRIMDKHYEGFFEMGPDHP